MGWTGAGAGTFPSSTERGAALFDDRTASTSEMNRKIPAHHHVIFVSSVVAWRPPMNCSVPAPPPSDANPLRDELGDVLGVHAAAVQDPGSGDPAPAEPGADLAMHGRGVVRRSVAPGPDRPHRLVGDADARKRRAVEARERARELAHDHRQRMPGVALGQGLAHAQERHQSSCQGGRHLATGVLVRLTEHVPALGVTDQRGFRSRLGG